MHDDAPFWVRLGLTDLATRRHAVWFRNASAALGAALVAAGLVEPHAALLSTAFFAVTAWVHTSMAWTDERGAW